MYGGPVWDHWEVLSINTAQQREMFYKQESDNEVGHKVGERKLDDCRTGDDRSRGYDTRTTGNKDISYYGLIYSPRLNEDKIQTIRIIPNQWTERS